MSTQIFVNLPCHDLPKAKAFYEAIGYTNNPQFTDDKAVCMVVDDTIHVMLLTREFFGSFVKKPVADTRQVVGEMSDDEDHEIWRQVVGAINCLSLDSREAVDDIHSKAVKAGGKSGGDPQDMGFMYSRAFEDLDGNHWEFVHMSGMPDQA